MRRVVQRRNKSMNRVRIIGKVMFFFMRFAAGFQSVGAKTSNESSTFEKRVEPQHHFERCICVRKSEIRLW